MKKILVLLLLSTLISCGDDSSENLVTNSIIEGTWKATNPERTITFNGQNWSYSEEGVEYSKGYWNTNSGENENPLKVIVVLSKIKINGTFQNIPEKWNSIKTNSVDCYLTEDKINLQNSQFQTSGVWGTLEGVYTKQ